MLETAFFTLVYFNHLLWGTVDPEYLLMLKQVDVVLNIFLFVICIPVLRRKMYLRL